ncbi:hypothetical protein RLIN73S_03893 [Rhodanobacter lindaniclasticus]
MNWPRPWSRPARRCSSSAPRSCATELLAALRQLQAQHHVQGASADMDVIACRIEAGLACISVLFFRNGISLGTRDFFPRLPLDAEAADVLAQFIAQYYL